METDRLRSAAAEYPYLRGLTAIPLGLLFLVSALGNCQWGRCATTGCSSPR